MQLQMSIDSCRVRLEMHLKLESIIRQLRIDIISWVVSGVRSSYWLF